MIKGNFNTDPLTGMSNLFGLLESDIGRLCGDKGVIVAFDIAGFSEVNNMYGKDTGDAYIKKLGRLIDEKLHKYYPSCLDSGAFRIGGDEFITILPDKAAYDANVFADIIERSFKKPAGACCKADIGLRTAVITYSSKIESVQNVLKLVSIAISKSKDSEESRLPLPKWADNLIENMISRIRETLVLLHQANTLALSDEISGLPNHRAAEIHMNNILNDYKRNGNVFSILFIDGDNLRQYNELGYQRGNLMIRDLASLLKASVRKEDLVFRWLSGDEFLVLLDNTGQKDALILGERVRAAIEIGTKPWPYPITVTIGVSSCPLDGESIDVLVSVAETANSAAKRSGKNLVLCSTTA